MIVRQPPATTPLDPPWHSGIHTEAVFLLGCSQLMTNRVESIIIELRHSCTTRDNSKGQLWLRDSINVAETFSELLCMWRNSFPLSFHRCQTCIMVWALSLLKPLSLYHSQVIPPINISHTHLPLALEDPNWQHIIIIQALDP